MQIFAEVQYFCKHFQTAMTPEQDLWDMIAIIIILNTLYNNFDTTIARLLETKVKLIDQIQSILQLKEVKNISKQTTRVVEDLAITYKKNNN